MPAQLAFAEKKYMVSRNEFYIAATLLAIAISTGKNDVQVSWIYNGREDLATAASVGLLFRDLPVAVRLRDDMTLRDVFTEVHAQVQDGIKHSCYSYLESKSQVVDGDIASVLYQRDLREVGDMGGLAAETTEILQNKPASQTVLDIQILDGTEGLQYVFDYAASRYEQETMLTFQDLFKRVVATIAGDTNAEISTFCTAEEGRARQKELCTEAERYLCKKEEVISFLCFPWFPDHILGISAGMEQNERNTPTYVNEQPQFVLPHKLGLFSMVIGCFCVGSNRDRGKRCSRWPASRNRRLPIPQISCPVFADPGKGRLRGNWWCFRFRTGYFRL